MPKEGYKTITVSDEIYDKLRQNYVKNKKEYLKKGITTFAGYLMYLSEQQEKKGNL